MRQEIERLGHRYHRVDCSRTQPIATVTTLQQMMMLFIVFAGLLAGCVLVVIAEVTRHWEFGCLLLNSCAYLTTDVRGLA